MSPTLGEQQDLREQLERARAALRAKPHEKVSLVLEQMPALVKRLERVQLYQTEIADLRRQLIDDVAKLQRLIWDAMKHNPDATFRGAQIRKAANEIERVLARIAELVGP